MEKLIELLNEYLFTLWRKTIIQSFDDRTLNDYCWTFRWIVEWKTDYPYTAIWWIEVISKKFWFIKWLVENEKIEYRKIIEKEIEVWFKLVRIKDYPNKIMEEDVEELLMLLAIQDEPIKFLTSILK